MNIVDAIDDPNLFAPWFPGASWDGWRAILRAAFALPMSAEERAFFRTVADRDPPRQRVRELWIVAGRRAGKDSVASVIAAHTAALFAPGRLLRPGERALVTCLACDRDQAKIVLGYVKSFFADNEMLRALVTRDTAGGLELENSVDIAVGTNSFRAVRGRAVLLAILDECAFWRSDDSATPDEETYRALRPGMATIPDAMLVGISSPYRRAGLLYKKWRAHYGKDDDAVLVVRAPSLVLNPTLDRAIVDEAMEADPAAAAAEWLAEWRSDIESFVNPETVDACVVPGRHELPPSSANAYLAFVDPSGGSADSMTLAIAHTEGDRGVLDAVRERRPPFSPDDVVQEFAALVRSYDVSEVVGDRYAGEWPRERFRMYGVEYLPAERPKSDIYRDLLPILNAHRADLLDLPRLKVQLCGLERRTARGGRDSIDHSPGAHDDVANAVAGVLTRTIGDNAMEVWRRLGASPSSAPAAPAAPAGRFETRVRDGRLCNWDHALGCWHDPQNIELPDQPEGRRARPQQGEQTP
jgi:hypothetical protein